jgi:iron(III) transport system substrate-binding protein
MTARGPRLPRLLVVAVTQLVVGLTLAGCGGGGGAGTIVLYNGQHPQLTTALVQAFTRQTGVHVSVRTGDGIVLANQILQEGSASPADVYLTENSPELMNLEGHRLLATLPSTILDLVPARDESPAGKWVGVALRVSSLAYDPAQLSPSQLPTSVLQLAQPQWKGKIAIAPTDSDFPPLVGAIIANYGTRAAEHWLAGLKQNAQTYQDEESVVAAVNRGDYWYRLRLEVGNGAIHSRLYYFPGHDVGSIENVSGAAILASSKHRLATQAFLTFLVSPTGQRIIARSYDYEYPARPRIAPNPALPSLNSISPATLSATALGTDQAASQLIQQAGLV